MRDRGESRAVVTLYLVRHGETVGGSAKGYKGTLDIPLSERGLEEMRITADFIHRHIGISSSLRRKSYLREIHGTISDIQSAQNGDDMPAASIYCSGLSRARKSAEAIASVFNTPPVVIKDLRERHFGIWEGMSFGDIKKDYPDEFARWASNPVRFSPPDGETTQQVYERTVSALDRLLDMAASDRNRDKNIIIVAHGGVNRIMLCHIMGIPLENIFRIEQDSSAVSIIEFWDRYPVVKSLNISPMICQR